MSYLPSPIKLHDYAIGVMAAFGSVVEHLGRVRGMPGPDDDAEPAVVGISPQRPIAHLRYAG